MQEFWGVTILLFLLCGRSYAMLGGTEVPIETIPYQGSLETSQIQCSMAILSSKYAITTGTCAEMFRVNLDIAYLRFGTTSRWYDGVERSCSALTQHPKFKIDDNTTDQKDYDVAILEIFPELTLNNTTMKAIAVADAAPALGTTLKVSGWGSIRDGGSIMVYARATTVSVSDQTKCRTTFADVFPVSDRMFCAGNPNGMACDAEYSDLLTTTDGKLVGLNSWGYGCGRSGIPDVYVNLANFEIRQFIKDVAGV